MFFKPWIGEHYANSQKDRLQSFEDDATGALFQTPLIHLMGESHYGEPHENEPGNTIRIMRECALQQSSCSGFFTKLANLFTGILNVEKSGDYRQAIWGRLAFSNFVQEVLPKSRKAPTQEQWDKGRIAFLKQLEITTPALLIVTSYRAWNELPPENCVNTGPVPARIAAEADMSDSRFYTYHLNGRLVWTHAICIAHPSGRGFKSGISKGKIQNALALQNELPGRFFQFDDDGELAAPQKWNSSQD